MVADLAGHSGLIPSYRVLLTTGFPILRLSAGRYGRIARSYQRHEGFHV